jgi:hypothetical protein
MRIQICFLGLQFQGLNAIWQRGSAVHLCGLNGRKLGSTLVTALAANKRNRQKLLRTTDLILEILRIISHLITLMWLDYIVINSFPVP